MLARLPASVDAGRMVAERRSFEGSLPVATLPRLVDALASDAGIVAYRLDFQQGPLRDAELHIRLKTCVTLECQRTLQLFEHPLELDRWLGLLVDEGGLGAMPAHCEPLLLEDGKLRPRQAIEDELLLALPLVPVKPGSVALQGEWAGSARVSSGPSRATPCAHPFADLRGLLAAGAKHQ